MSTEKRRRINYNWGKTMDVDAWRERQIHKRLEKYLEQREQSFLRDHAGDTDAELAEYVRSRARNLGRMPHPLELPGGNYLQERLGDWNTLAQNLGFIPASRNRGRLVYSDLKKQITEQFARERRIVKAKKQRKSAQQ